jgi:hypothetical protein
MPGGKGSYTAPNERRLLVLLEMSQLEANLLLANRLHEHVLASSPPIPSTAQVYCLDNETRRPAQQPPPHTHTHAGDPGSRT